MRYLATKNNPEEMKMCWDQVIEVKRTCWREQHAANQRKVEHLIKKSTNCGKHKRCSELSNLVGSRAKSWFRNADGSGGSSPTPRSCLPGTPPGLNIVFKTKSEDLTQLKTEEEKLLYEVRKHNQELVCENLDESQN